MVRARAHVLDRLVIQRTFMGSAITLVRAGEAVQYSWLCSRAITPQEQHQAVEPWPFYTGTRSALQISVLAVVFAFSTVVPVIVPFGALYMIMRHWTDKYALLYVRPRVPGRGSICRSATHATLFCLIIYQAAMAGFFLLRGTLMQSVSILTLLALTYPTALWFYIRDKRIEYQGTARVVDEQASLLSEPLDQYREPALREKVYSPT